MGSHARSKVTSPSPSPRNTPTFGQMLGGACIPLQDAQNLKTGTLTNRINGSYVFVGKLNGANGGD